MKDKISIIALVCSIVAILMVGVVVFPDTAASDTLAKVLLGKTKSKDACTTIQSGELYGSDGGLLSPGYNEWGYNYQAHMFNGMWCDYHPLYRPGGAQHDWCVENYGNVRLMMKWSDEWLANKDCNGDGNLDRGYSCDAVNANNSGCPGAWLTNHESEMYELNGRSCNREYFVKIVAAPADAYTADGIWYTADGVEIGEVIWGAFAITQEVNNDSCAGLHGKQYLSPAGPGFGKYK